MFMWIKFLLYDFIIICSQWTNIMSSHYKYLAKSLIFAGHEPPGGIQRSSRVNQENG